MARSFHLLRRHDDGTTVLECNDALGYSQLTVQKDGSRSTYTLVGVCGDCMAGRHARVDCPWRVDRDKAMGLSGADISASPAIAPVVDEVESPVVEPEQVAHSAPVVEPESLTEPVNPVNEKLDREAQMVARSVWFHGGQHRHQLFQGRGQMSADALLSYAVERGWVRAHDDGMVVPGAVNPVQKMPVVEHSRRERVAAWGPGPGARW